MTRPKGEKIARAKNNLHELSLCAKKVGSNYHLSDGRLSGEYKYEFAALAAGGGAASAAPNPHSISQIVNQTFDSLNPMIQEFIEIIKTLPDIFSPQPALTTA